MSDSYVTSKAVLKCTFGSKTSNLTVLPSRTVNLTGKPDANVSDHIPMTNIAPFGKCRTVCFPPTGAATAANHGRLTPMPCVPGTVSEWMNGKNDYLIKGKPALLKSSICRCQWGGVISIVSDGQVDTGPADLSKELAKSEEQIKAETEEKLKVDPEAVLDGIQLALDAAGFVPGLGAIPDLANAAISACRGDWTGAGLSVLAAVPIVGDAAAGAKLAQKGLKAAKAAKKAGTPVKAANMGQPFGSLTAKTTPSMPQAPASSALGKPFLSMTAKTPTTPAKTVDTPKFGSLTTSGRKPSTPSTSSTSRIQESVTKIDTKPSNNDSLKEVFKYKGNNAGNNVKPDNAGDNLDLSF